MDALDLSNNTPRFSRTWVQARVAEGIGLGIVQLISGVRLAGDDCGTQIGLLLDGGMAVDCYLFPGNDGLPLSTAQRLALVPAEYAHRIRQFWVDVETAFTLPTKNGVSEALAGADAYAPWQRTGTYSALWVAEKMGWLPWPWPNRKQWLVYVRNDGHPNLSGAFAGTNQQVMTQYGMDVVLDGVGGMDRSLLSDSEAAAVTAWLAGDLPPIVKEGPMTIKVGDGMKARMDAAGDAPMADHVQYKQTDDEGVVYEVEKCLGSKGLYVSSNAGAPDVWVNTGPLAVV